MISSAVRANPYFGFSTEKVAKVDHLWFLDERHDKR